MRKIQLKGKYFHLYALVDDEDYEFISQYNWYGLNCNGIIYAIGRLKHSSAPLIFMHRLILNAPQGKDVDHKNHNVLNNQRSNIRICTRSQNRINSRSMIGTSKYKGIYRYKPYMKWRARVRIPNPNGGLGKRKHLGYFDNEIEAAQIYDKAAKEYHGEFAYLNFPEKD